MAAVSIIALGNAIGRATSTPVTVAAGEVKTVGLYVAAGDVPADVMAYVAMRTPGAPVRFDRLTSGVPGVALVSPGDYDVYIDSVGRAGVNVGAFVSA